MATTKSSKKSPAKKKAAPAKATTKKGSVKARPLTWRFYAVTIGIFFIAIGTVVVIALFTASFIAKEARQDRLGRIDTVYSSLNLGDSYKQESSNVYLTQVSRTIGKQHGYGSQVSYLRGDTVSNTVADVDKKIKAAGFSFVDEPYPADAAVQYQYQSSNGETIRLIVTSKPYEDAHLYADIMDKEVSDDTKAMDKNAGPAKVTIQVRLNDTKK